MAKCPACPKQSSEIGVVLHYQKALSGAGRERSENAKSEPHVEWAESNGVTVREGWMFNDEALRIALRSYFQK